MFPSHDRQGIYNILSNSVLANENPDKARNLAVMLSRAKTPQQKNALRFKLLQDPDYRRTMKELNTESVK